MLHPKMWKCKRNKDILSKNGDTMLNVENSMKQRGTKSANAMHIKFFK